MQQGKDAQQAKPPTHIEHDCVVPGKVALSAEPLRTEQVGERWLSEVPSEPSNSQ